jgi:tubulin polyglutamylase TTLL5
MKNMNTPNLTIRKYSPFVKNTSPRPVNEIGLPGGLASEKQSSQFEELLWKLGEPEDLRPPIVELEGITENQMIKEGIPISTYLKGFPNTCQLSYKTFKTEARLVRSILENSGFFYTDSHNWNVLWSGVAPPDYLYESLNPFQKINHFPASNELTRKDRMCINLKMMSEKHGKKHFDFVPDTFVLPEEFSQFYSDFSGSKNRWIVKPSCSSQGRGIFLLDNIQDVPLDEACIISRYIKDPYLLNGLKFDLRIYVLVTSFQPLRIYVYKEGLARFASEKYVNDLTENKFIHLTNYSVNKKNQKFIQNTDANCDGVGHKWSLKALMKVLTDKGEDIESLWLKIYDIIIKSIISIEGPVLEGMKRLGLGNNCFDLFGFDILIDSSLKPWLLEVNLSPSLATDSPLDFYIKSSLITDSLNLVGIFMKQSRKSHVKNLGKIMQKMKNSPYMPAKIAKNQFSKQKTVELLRESVEELNRKQNFLCIFPCKHGEKYDQFSEISRNLNRTLRAFLFDKNFEISQLTAKTKKVPTKKIFQNSFELQLNAKAVAKATLNGDDLLQEYLNRCLKWLKQTNDSNYPENLKSRMERFFNHYSWKTLDTTEKSLSKKLMNRIQEMTFRKSERPSKSLPRKLTPNQFSSSSLVDYSDEEISNLLTNSNKELSYDLISILTEGEGLLSMVSRYAKLKDIKRTKSPFLEKEKRIHSFPQRPKTSNRLKYVN